MANQIEFVYHPSTNTEIDEEKARRVKILIAEFLVKKAIEKAASS
ncbi:hypothetical protein JOC95_002024 [Bacillus tianshenii]|uniref:Uncharacterized protein n=1 Tax=Sutcliffiella tianshenii TaxID=1463404 RepID=A0ABS2NZP0_9BACI|nr:hypothetical protein [Bacillus tianshenii]MBM7620171.1 hypothetical protein [Bacillus tianshenii]